MHPNDVPRYVTVRDYLRVLRARRLLIAVVTLVFGAAGFALAAAQEPVYVSQAAISFPTSSAESNLLGGSNEVNVPQPSISAQLVEQERLARAVAGQVSGDLSAEEIRSATSASVETATGQVVIEARADDPELVAEIANAMAQEVADVVTREERERFARAAAQLRREFEDFEETTTTTEALAQQQLARLEALSTFVRPSEVAQPAVAPSGPMSPNPVRNTLLGLALGLTLGIAGAFFRDSLDRRLHGSGEMEEHLSLPLLGQVNRDALGHSAFSANGAAPLERAHLEAFHILRTNLDLSRRDHPPRVFAVASGLPEEGKSTVSAGLATVNATSGKRTILVECDLRRPSLAGRASLKQGPGVSEYVTGTATLDQIVQSVAVARPAELASAADGPGAGTNGAGASAATATRERAHLDCITAGTHTENGAELLGSQRFKNLMFELIDTYDAVILDTSPVLSVADTRELLPLVDFVLLCVRASKTTRDEASAAKQALAAYSSLPLALIATGVSPRDDRYYGYYTYARAGDG